MPSSWRAARKDCRIPVAGRAQGVPPAGERPCAKHIPFTGHAPGRALFLRSACPCAGHWPASGARTGRALQNGCARRQWRSISLAIGRRAVAQAVRHWQSVKPQAARHWQSVKREAASGTANGRPNPRPCLGAAPFCRARLRARTTGPPLARLQPVQGHKGLLPRQKAQQKARPSARKFFQLFFKTPLRTLRQCGKLAAVQRAD